MIWIESTYQQDLSFHNLVGGNDVEWPQTATQEKGQRSTAKQTTLATWEILRTFWGIEDMVTSKL